MAHKARRRATACPTMGLWRATDSNMGVTDSVSTWGCLGNNIDAPDAVYKIDANIRGKLHWFLISASSPVSQTPLVHRFCFPNIPRCIDFFLKNRQVHRFCFPNILRCIDVISQTTAGATFFWTNQHSFVDFVDNDGDDWWSYQPLLGPLTSNIDSLASNVT